jgi:hypothetical protein
MFFYNEFVFLCKDGIVFVWVLGGMVEVKWCDFILSIMGLIILMASWDWNHTFKDLYNGWFWESLVVLGSGWCKWYNLNYVGVDE